MLYLLLLALVALGANAHSKRFNYGDDPFWVVSHGPLMSTRLDPIVSPGSVSSHVHTIIGTSSFLPTYTYENSVAGKCTTANVDIDKSSYWIPSLYRKTSAGFTLVPLSYANTYYQTRRYGPKLLSGTTLIFYSTGQEPIYEFPPGFRMLAGNAPRATFNASDPTNQAVRYACLNFHAPATDETNAFPTTNCPDGLRAEVYFPHCWDGVNNWLEGSKHVSYGEGAFDQGGVCPSTHPKRIMGLFYEFIFKDDYDYEEGARVWSTGDTRGYSFHGDFTNGWPEGLFQDIFNYGKTCSVGPSVENCPPLAPHLKKNAPACTPEGVIVNEDIGLNTISALPGNNPLWGGDVVKPVDTNYTDTGTFVSAADNATATIQPSGTGVPAQLIASDIRMDTVSGDPVYVATTRDAASTTVALPNASNTDTSATVSTSSTTAISSVTQASSTSVSSVATDAPTPVLLLADASVLMTVASASTAGQESKSCSRSRKRGLAANGHVDS